MKKLFKILAYIILTIITVLGVTFFSLKYYMANNWKNHYTEQEMVSMADSINNAPKLTAEFYKAYELIYPGAKNRTLSTFENDMGLLFITAGKSHSRGYKPCNCIRVAHDFENRFQPNVYYSWLMLAHGLEQKSSEVKCLDYLYNKQHVKEICFSHFGKNIQELCFEEAVEFILLMQAPSIYSTTGYQRLQSKVRGYLNN